MYRRILVPLDGSAASRRGLKHAIALARETRARLRALHVVDETPMLGMLEEGVDLQPFVRDLDRRGRAILEQAKREAAKSGVALETSVGESAGGPVADRILGEAKRWRAGLIVMGTHGRRGLRHVVLGSEAERVVHRSPVPVLLVRASD